MEQITWNIWATLPGLGRLMLGLVFLTTVGYNEIGVSSAGGRQYSSTKYERMESKPWFRPTQQNITVHPGDRAVLRCRVENLGTKTVTWRKEGDMTPLTIGFFTFSPDTRIQLDHSLRTREWSLIIQAVKPEDEGWYHCQVTTKQEEMFYSIKLNVLTVQVTGTEYVERGNPIQLICNATGKPDPPHNVDWFMDGTRLESDAEKGIIITKKIETKVLVSMLVIKKSKLSDAADYICRSSNQDAGSITVHILNVAAPNTSKRDDYLNKGHQNSAFLGANRGRGSGNTIHRKWISYTIAITSVSILWFYDIRWQHCL